MEYLNEIELSGNRMLKIYQDVHAESPRTFSEHDTVFKFGKSRRYSYPDESGFERFDSIAETIEYANKIKAEGGIVLGVEVYDHSGRAFIPFEIGSGHTMRCGFDSAFGGIIYWPADKLKCIDAPTPENAKKCLVSELKEYAAWAEGDVFGYELWDITPCKTCGHSEEELLDECGGFYGDDALRDHIADNIDVTEDDMLEITKYL